MPKDNLYRTAPKPDENVATTADTERGGSVLPEDDPLQILHPFAQQLQYRSTGTQEN